MHPRRCYCWWSLSIVSLSIYAANTPPATIPAQTIPPLNDPRSLALDKAGNVYIVDMSNDMVYKMDKGGDLSVLAGTPHQAGDIDGAAQAAKFNLPMAVALDKEGGVYIADGNNNAIRKISPAGIVTTYAGQRRTLPPIGSMASGSTGSLDFPTGVAVDGAGNLYVASNYNNIICKIAPDGTMTIIAGQMGNDGSVDGKGAEVRFGKPRAVAVDSAGNVYVIDEKYNTVRKIAPDGMVTTLAGNPAVADGSKDGTLTAATFSSPRGLAVDAKGFVYVADSGNNLIRKITPDGVVTTLAGHAGAAGFADGKGDAARFSAPRGVAVDEDGNVYVADTENCALRKITPDGTVTTIIRIPPATLAFPTMFAPHP